MNANLTNRTDIRNSLIAFGSGDLAENAISLLRVLGYRSKLTQQLVPNTASGLLELVNRKDFLNPARAHASEWKSIDFLFQLTDEEIRRLWDNEFDSGLGQQSFKNIQSYLFFAVQLNKTEYSRTLLSEITREINRLFDIPSMVIFKHGPTLTISIINRRVHKRDPARDVLEKVTLIKDIRIVDPHRGQIEILFDLAFPQLRGKHEITNFVQLDEAWRKALDTSELNKRFYKDLANWYFWALQHVQFPNQAGVTEDVNRATNVIRLITRLIFVWFLKERELVPEALFERASLDKLLKDLSPDKSTFYKAILQNLFIATLNTPMNDPNAPRVFRSETNGKRFNDQYMVHNQYRYQKLFSDPEHALEIFAGIPFLNGGLFECLDRSAEVDGKMVEIRIDGFSDVSSKQPKVPNKLFFGDEEQIDLNETYGTRGKKYSVRGLIDTLNRYKFTIAENTPIEEEVALDPELLGKVFENLLASYNPETKATARKETGSYYTHRDIVDYMVDESLIAYLQAQLTANDKLGDILNRRLHHLFSYTDEPHQFSPAEVDKLIAAIDAVKILDPACGSGAFPMGILQRCVFILAKLDPQNSKWKQRQIGRVRAAMKAAERIEDIKFRESALHDLEAQIESIEEAFQRNELDYGRKLFLIENCIYGVDIQPIAIQIAKLRFFISLVIDQRIRPEADNLGIRALPNLETRFVAANTLLNLDKPAQSLLRNTSIDEKERELRTVRDRYFTARTTRTKEKYRKEDERLRREIGALLESDGNFPHETTEKLVGWNPYDQNTFADFFDAEWMFGLPDGFDIIIGNPPWISNDSISDPLKSALRQSYTYSVKSRFDLSCVFVELAKETLMRPNGVTAYVLPEHLWLGEYFIALREATYRNWTEVTSLKEGYFEAVNNPASFLILSEKQSEEFIVGRSSFDRSVTRIKEQKTLIEREIQLGSRGQEIHSYKVFFDPDYAKLKSRMTSHADFAFLDSVCIVTDGVQTANLLNTIMTNETPTNKSQYHKALRRGKAIPFRYGRLVWDGWWILKPEFTSNLKRPGFSYDSPKRMLCFKAPQKIVMRQTEPTIVATIDTSKFYFPNSIFQCIVRKECESQIALYYVLALLNSSLVRSYYLLSSQVEGTTKPQLYINLLKSIPIRSIDPASQKELSENVEEILSRTSASDYGVNETKQSEVYALERAIDQLVYRLYNLRPEEITVVERAMNPTRRNANVGSATSTN